ncbi:MAG: hypothetical protein ACOH2J_03080 [Allorhizobium sp.]
MNRKTILLSVAGLIGTVIIIDAAVALISASDSLAGPVDLAGVSKIRVEGTASDITISADSSRPLVAELKGERHGWGALWHSGWFSDSCPTAGSLSIDSETLVVNVGRQPRLLGWSGWSDCTMTLSANLKPEASVVIAQQAARARISGDYAAVEIHSDAGDLSFQGHAQSMSLEGAALRARLVYDRVTNNETIAISGAMLDAGITFLVPTPISYLVEAVGSYVDSALANTPGAKPAITIRGAMVRATIR